MYKKGVDELRMAVLGFLAIVLLLLFYYASVGLVQIHIFLSCAIIITFSLVILWFGFLYLRAIRYLDPRKKKLVSKKSKKKSKRVTKKSKK